MFPTLFFVTFIVFSMVRVMPGDVVLIQLSEAPSFRQEDADRLRDQLGLSDPWYVQYPEWVQGVAQFDLGKSLWSDRAVSELIKERIWITFELAILAFIISNVVALSIGVISAIRQDTPLDYVLRLVSITGLSIPGFWIATIVIVMGARWFGYLPPLTHIPFSEDPVGNLKQFLLPSTIIAIASSATLMRMVRSSMLEVLRQDYIRTAWSKGLRERQVIYRHSLRNALMPVITLQGVLLANLLTGSLITEVIFNLPGLGRLTYDAIQTRDYTLIQGAVLVFGIIFVVSNFVVDLAYGWLDPRVKY
jgi:peptide/nickel transport system permease protein